MSASLVGSEMCIRDSSMSFKQLYSVSSNVKQLQPASSTFKRLLALALRGGNRLPGHPVHAPGA
eukprot:15058817-Alexandrium_andersonii.AAC.1